MILSGYYVYKIQKKHASVDFLYIVDCRLWVLGPRRSTTRNSRNTWPEGISASKIRCSYKTPPLTHLPLTLA